jgi:glycosyltransferase involved in cell wall biosynthesis
VKILHTTHSYYPEKNGISEVVSQVSRGLVSLGHDVYIATSLIESATNYEQLSGVKVNRFAISGNYLDGIKGHSDEIKRYLDFVLKSDWDVIVNHAGQSWPTDLLIDHVGRVDVPFIYVPHGMSGINDPKWSEYFSMMPELFQRYTHISCLSESFDEKPFCDTHNIKHHSVIPNGVNLNEFEKPQLIDVRTTWEIGKKKLILNISNHNPLKGHKEFIQLAKKFDSDFVFVNIGNSYPAAKFDLGKFGIQGGCYYECLLKSRIVKNYLMKTHVPREEILSALKTADLFVLTSNWEASPIVILEAMASGLPWLSFNVGNVKEQSGGVVVDDLRHMIVTMKELFNDRELTMKLSEAGRKQILERNNWKNIVKMYENLYVSVLRGR